MASVDYRIHRASRGGAFPTLDPMAQDGVQPGTPYLDALRAYAARSPGRFHVPGHKGGAAADPVLVEAFGERALALDIPALTEGIDAGPEPTPFQRAQQLAAAGVGRRAHVVPDQRRLAGQPRRVRGARPGQASSVVVQRNVHSSTVDGLIVSGLRPCLRGPGDRSRARHRALRHAGGARSRARRRARTRPARWSCRRRTSVPSRTWRGSPGSRTTHGVPLVVDEAWGAHLAFGPSLPRHALECGADLVVSSTHKIIGSFTQSAMLHLGRAGGSTSTSSTARSRCSSRPARARCCPARSMPRAPSRPRTARGCSRRRSARWRPRGRRSGASPASTCSTSASPSGPGCTRTTRCGSSSTCAAPGVSGYRLAQLMRERDIHPELAGRERDRGGVRHGGDGERQRRPPGRGARAGGDAAPRRARRRGRRS